MKHLERHLTEWMGQAMEGDYPLADMTQDKIQEIYALAFFFYEKKHYQEASYFFRLLAVLRPSVISYWKGLGACLQMLRDYKEALNCYMSAQNLNREKSDPYLYVYAADCYFALKQIKPGLKSLDAARLSAEQTQDARVLQHVTFMRSRWS